MKRTVLSSAAVIWAVAMMGAERYGRPLAPQAHHNAGTAWNATRTDNFHIYGSIQPTAMRSWGERLERMRRELFQKWMGITPAGDWNPRCTVILHPSAESYARAVPGSESTLGSSLVERRGDEAVLRRIDVRPMADERLRGTLRHELMHVIVAERFKARTLPAWADEGIAVLEDSPDIRRGHQAYFHGAAARQGIMPLPELLNLTDIRFEMAPLFYGQSASLVEFLVGRTSPEAFLRFVDDAERQGYDAALAEHFRIDGVQELHRMWRATILAP